MLDDEISVRKGREKPVKTKEVIAVKNLLSKADESLKVFILKTSLYGRRSLSAQAVDALVEGITSQIKDAQVKVLDASRMVIAQGVASSWPSPYNDPESDAFTPEDETPKIFDAMQEADVVVFTTDTSWSFPSSKMVAIMERLNGFKTGIQSNQVVMQKKVAGVIVTSQSGGEALDSVASLTAFCLQGLGFTIPGHCVITSMNGQKDAQALKKATEDMADALVDAAMMTRRT